MWVLLSTLCFVVVGISGRAHEGVLLVNPDDVELQTIPSELISSEEITLPDNLTSNEDVSEEMDTSEEINLPDNITPPGEADLPEGSNQSGVNIQDEVDAPIFLVNSPSVTIAQGTVVGLYSEDESYLQFYGIPYADATSGSNRFKAPRAPPVFQDVFIADRKDIKCVRSLGNGYEGTEDCLVANIFTPTVVSTSMLPVMVWVKGKEFDRAYEYEPSFENFVDQGVVIVTLNYRESVLGFLCLGTDIAPGNAGLKDIIAGLRWVRENIAQFGGNPNDITLIGHGSGAAAVDLVTMSPMANGLVHKAITQSGSALSPWAVTRDSVHYAVEVAEAMGHIITNIEELSQVFQRTSVAALMGVINDLDLTDNSLAFSPCIERDNLTDVEPFMIKSPYQILEDGEFLQIPFITGYVDNEGTIRSEEAVEDDWLEKMDESFTDFIQPDLDFENNQEKTEIAQNIRSFYFNDNPINLENAGNYIRYHGDTMILVSALREVRMRISNSNSPVYVYQFSYKGSLGEPFVGPLVVNTAAHSEELAYIFYDKNDNGIPERDRSIGDVLVERWSWFAKTGQPLSATSTVFWPAYTVAQSNYLRILDISGINGQSAIDIALVNPQPEAVAFWDPIYEEHFLDAEGRWEITERNEGEDEDDGQGGNGEEGSGEEGSGEEGSGEEGSGEEGSGEEGSGEEGSEEEGDNEEEEGVGNSASSAVGYTFSIIALFSILNQLHLSQLLS